LYGNAPHMPPHAAAPPGDAPGNDAGAASVLNAGVSMLDEARALLSFNAGPPVMDYAAEEHFTRCATLA
jgi:hypothetical protein